MCCVGNAMETQKFYKKHSADKIVEVFKVVKRGSHTDYTVNPVVTRENVLKGVYQSHFLYKPGLIEPKDIYSSRITMNISITRGIHVWLDRKSANKHCKKQSLCKVITLITNIDDLIAVGGFDEENNNAVFRKVILTPSEYKKATKVTAKG